MKVWIVIQDWQGNSGYAPATSAHNSFSSAESHIKKMWKAYCEATEDYSNPPMPEPVLLNGSSYVEFDSNEWYWISEVEVEQETAPVL